MSKAVIVTFERKSYTFDGKHWYGTADYMVPTRSIIGSLAALIPEAPPVKIKKPTKARR
jgi:hypothetical protein